MRHSSRPHIIGIAGASCSGKSVLAERLAKHLEKYATAVVSMDAYYCGLSHLAEQDRKSHNFDVPEALDWDLLRAHLRTLSKGQSIAMPVYDFASHTRTNHRETVAPARFLIVEGLLALHDPALRRLLDTKVFVKADDAVCLARRIERDVRDRGRTRESVERQYRETVLPMAHKYVLPQEKHADAVVDGCAILDASVQDVVATLGPGGLAD